MRAVDGASDRIWTLPNALTFLRLALIPVFLWLALDVRDLRWAVAVGGLGFVTDLVDGPIARRSGTVTKLGIVLDPLSDRLSLVAGAAVILMLDLAWAPLIWVVIARDAVLAFVGAPYLKATGRPIPPVTRLGKRASFGISVGLGLFIVAAAVGSIEQPNEFVRTVAYVITGVAAVAYLVTFAQYVRAGLSTPRGL